MAGFQALNEEVEGTLEILKGGKVIEALEKEDNTLYYPDGYWEESVIFYQGEEAKENSSRELKERCAC